MIRIAKFSLNRNNHPCSIPAQLWPFLAISSRAEKEMYSLLPLQKTFHICLPEIYFDSEEILVVVLWQCDSRESHSA